ncbi:NUDIX hydrolase [Aeromicrobium panaciterrae]|uniref:NUDIX hydrolase n=1 Tax=Aeromicrobium panaciterrae TaxID=363861 RepID=UPI0031D3C1C0
MAREQVTTAAGGIVWRKRAGSGRTEPRVDLLLIHRPRYDDWTFPKGKTEPGETLQATATREIAEETGARVRLGHPLGELTYPVSDGMKSVSYWSARLVGEQEPFTPNKEVDEVRWVGVREARKLLTYDHDTALLETFVELLDRKAHRTRTLVVLRHGKAAPRSADLPDLERPLTTVGSEQSKQVLPVLAAYGVSRVVSSPALRCAQTVEPYAYSISTFIEIDERLSEQTDANQVHRSVESMLDRGRPVVLCSHRPTLPWIFQSIGTDAYDLGTGEGVVVHHRKGVVLAVEKLA